MSYDRDGFMHYFAHQIGAQPNTRATYASFLNRIDTALGGLDHALASKSADAVTEWAKTTDAEPFATYRSHARSVLKRYILYKLENATGFVDHEAEPETDGALLVADPVDIDANFLREKEMQAQVRKQLGSLEAGLTAIDDGVEVTVATGRIDILARDADKRLVVIELKPGKCPPGALEQLLAYAYDIEQDRGEAVRAILVAGSFGDRTRAAAKRAGNVELRSYAYTLNFQLHD